MCEVPKDYVNQVQKQHVFGYEGQSTLIISTCEAFQLYDSVNYGTLTQLLYRLQHRYWLDVVYDCVSKSLIIKSHTGPVWHKVRTTLMCYLPEDVASLVMDYFLRIKRLERKEPLQPHIDQLKLGSWLDTLERVTCKKVQGKDAKKARTFWQELIAPMSLDSIGYPCVAHCPRIE